MFFEISFLSAINISCFWLVIRDYYKEVIIVLVCIIIARN
jgi:hypothetical protein